MSYGARNNCNLWRVALLLHILALHGIFPPPLPGVCSAILVMATSNVAWKWPMSSEPWLPREGKCETKAEPFLESFIAGFWVQAATPSTIEYQIYCTLGQNSYHGCNKQDNKTTHP
jgi:hypothetical protein